jgi:hypothetical protein
MSMPLAFSGLPASSPLFAWPAQRRCRTPGRLAPLSSVGEDPAPARRVVGVLPRGLLGGMCQVLHHDLMDSAVFLQDSIRLLVARWISPSYPQTSFIQLGFDKGIEVLGIHPKEVNEPVNILKSMRLSFVI